MYLRVLQVGFYCCVRDSHLLGPLRIEWKRSSEDGKTKAVNVLDSVATFNEKIEFKSNLFLGKDDLAKKLLFFHLKEKNVFN